MLLSLPTFEPGTGSRRNIFRDFYARMKFPLPGRQAIVASGRGSSCRHPASGRGAIHPFDCRAAARELDAIRRATCSLTA
jgi:hypothetical protein